MAITVKKKIWLGTLFLFLLLLLTGSASIYYVARLKSDAENVLQDNYESVSYAQSMQQQINEVEINFNESVQKFEIILEKQEHNITENGELQATTLLRNYFNKIKHYDTSAQNLKAIREQLLQVQKINLSAIKRKNSAATHSANDALTILITLSGIIFLISFTFIVNFPSIVTKPIIELTDAIKEISNKNYRYRIHINNKDEFGKLADAFNNMAERLEYFENSSLNKLIFEKNRAEAVINSLKDASIGIDKNNIVLFANYQALQLLGLRAEDIVGKAVDELKNKNDLFGFLMNNDSTTPFKIVVDNKENYFIKEVMEVEQGDGKNKVIVLKNITSFKELDVAKTNFIATISHELKTPLASSDFSLKLLEDERISKLSSEQKDLIENLKHDNQRMLKILSELLNMSQVEAGKIHLNMQLVHPVTIIKAAIDTVNANAREKNITIKVFADNNLPEVHADKEKTTWVLNNFLSNAIKYSYENGLIEVHAFHQNNNLVFLVKDYGKGIEQEYQSKLFDRYFKVPGSNKKGTGLGLSISKEFIEAQHGKIWVESAPDKGAAFYFELPV